MNISFKILGLTFWAALAPVAASAQSLGPADPSPDGALVPSESTPSDINANPFTGAAGADKFYQDNSLSGASQQTSTSSSGSGTSVSSIPNGTPAPADSNAPDINANPFAGAAGANKFYQDNSLTGAASQPNNVGILGGGLGSSAQSWATTP